MAGVRCFQLCLRNSRSSLLCGPIKNQSRQITTSAAVAIDRKIRSDEGFWDKNDRMKRPMSPHLTIYKFQLPAIMSIAHRGTGAAFSGVTSAVALAALVAPDSLSHYLEIIKAWELPAWFLFSGKCVLVFPVMYHTFNGIRHLAWDTGRGFEMSRLYQTGWLVTLSSLLASLGVVYYVS